MDFQNGIAITIVIAITILSFKKLREYLSEIKYQYRFIRSDSTWTTASDWLWLGSAILLSTVVVFFTLAAWYWAVTEGYNYRDVIDSAQSQGRSSLLSAAIFATFTMFLFRERKRTISRYIITWFVYFIAVLVSVVLFSGL